MPWYTNSLAWNDERKISGKEAKRLLNQEKRSTAVIDGMERTYEMDYVPEDGIHLRIEGGDTRTISLHDLPGIMDKGDTAVGVSQIIGIAQDKLYFKMCIRDRPRCGSPPQTGWGGIQTPPAGYPHRPIRPLSSLGISLLRCV